MGVVADPFSSCTQDGLGREELGGGESSQEILGVCRMVTGDGKVVAITVTFFLMCERDFCFLFLVQSSFQNHVTQQNFSSSRQISKHILILCGKHVVTALSITGEFLYQAQISSCQQQINLRKCLPQMDIPLNAVRISLGHISLISFDSVGAECIGALWRWLSQRAGQENRHR